MDFATRDMKLEIQVVELKFRTTSLDP
jgi:hypothetical protein